MVVAGDSERVGRLGGGRRAGIRAADVGSGRDRLEHGRRRRCAALSNAGLLHRWCLIGSGLGARLHEGVEDDGADHQQERDDGQLTRGEMAARALAVVPGERQHHGQA